MTKKRVYLVDDHPIMRQGLGQLINHEPDMEVVGEASDAASGLTGVIESRPDLVIIDISLPGKNGLPATAASSLTMSASTTRLAST